MQRVFDRPQLIAVEGLSPEDRHSKVQEKIEDYLEFQVPHFWVIDPVKRQGWDCSTGNWIQKSRFQLPSSPIFLDLETLFTELDAAEA